MYESDVVIVGAGAAGLAAAVELRRFGVPAVVLERGDGIGASWRGRYDRLRLNTCRWTSTLPGFRYPRGTGLFPSRDEMVGYLEEYARRNELDIRLGSRVESIEHSEGGWLLRTAAGEHEARHVVVATGHQHTPQIPQWPGRDAYCGRVLHAAAYRNPDEFRDADILVVGPGCSGMEIAYDLAEGGAGRVWIAVRTQPNIMLRQSGGLPGDLPARALLRVPARIADRQAGLVRRLTIGDLSRWGLVPPEEGIFSRHHREAKAPAIVDKEVIEAIKRSRIEVVAAVASLDQTGVQLTDGSRLAPGAIIASTGYGSGLEPIVGHLGVLDERGFPRVHGGPAAAPGLRFIGYKPAPGQIGDMGREARRAAGEIKSELSARVPTAVA
jgi:cation diffusion facilitator CzcD-associated flavoprotein CzcO